MTIFNWKFIAKYLLVTGILLLPVMGCGKKAAPRQPKAPEIIAVDDLEYTIQDNLLILKWSISPLSKKELINRVSGVFVYQSMNSLMDLPCKGCPLLFKLVADLGLEKGNLKEGERVKMSYHESLKSGHRYSYKVNPHNISGDKGDDSNYVKFEFP